MAARPLGRSRAQCLHVPSSIPAKWRASERGRQLGGDGVDCNGPLTVNGSPPRLRIADCRLRNSALPAPGIRLQRRIQTPAHLHPRRGRRLLARSAASRDAAIPPVPQCNVAGHAKLQPIGRRLRVEREPEREPSKVLSRRGAGAQPRKRPRISTRSVRAYHAPPLAGCAPRPAPAAQRGLARTHPRTRMRGTSQRSMKRGSRLLRDCRSSR
jgi:hypothetical protein